MKKQVDIAAGTMRMTEEFKRQVIERGLASLATQDSKDPNLYTVEVGIRIKIVEIRRSRVSLRIEFISHDGMVVEESPKDFSAIKLAADETLTLWGGPDSPFRQSFRSTFNG